MVQVDFQLKQILQFKAIKGNIKVEVAIRIMVLVMGIMVVVMGIMDYTG